MLADEGGQLLHHHSFDVCCTIALPLEWELQCWPMKAIAPSFIRRLAPAPSAGKWLSQTGSRSLGGNGQHAWTAMNHRWNNRNMVGKIVKDNPLLLLPMLTKNF